MAELKKFEYIIEFEPYYMRNESGEVCFQSKKVRQLVRCRDCKYWFNAPAADGFNSCERDALIRHEDFFCAAGEKREES